MINKFYQAVFAPIVHVI